MWFIVYLLLCFGVAAIAQQRGHSGVGAFLLSLLLSPLIGLIVTLVFPGNSAKCPRCAETVKAEAHVCIHCGMEFPEGNSNPLQAATGNFFGAVLAIVVVILLIVFMFTAIRSCH